MKTNRAAKKRFKVTGSGKIMALGSGKVRKLKKKSTARKNNLKNYREVDSANSPKLRKMMGI